MIERYCGSLLPAVKSRSEPYTALSCRMLHCSQIAQIELQYDLGDALNFEDNVREVSSKEHVYPESAYFGIKSQSKLLTSY